MAGAWAESAEEWLVILMNHDAETQLPGDGSVVRGLIVGDGALTS